MTGYIYPFTPSQISGATVEQLLAFIKSPAMVARRLGEILQAQQFVGNFLLKGRYTIQGGAIAVPTNETTRTKRQAETVAPGAEYKLTPIEAELWEIYTAMKRGLATEVTDESIGRLNRQPIDDAFAFLANELVHDANELALGVIASSVTQSIAAGAAWTTGKQIIKDVLRAKADVSKLQLGYQLDTIVLNEEDYASVVPEIVDMLPKDDTSLVTGSFPTLLGLMWTTSPEADFTNPLLVDRDRLGGVARETIPSPEYRAVSGDTGVEIATIREAKADKSRLQARNPHVPVVTNPLAGIQITGTGL